MQSHNNNELQELYKNRFSDKENQKRKVIWQKICNYLADNFFSKNISSSSIVVDVAAGYCDFINNIFVGKEIHKYAVDINPDVKKYAADDVVVYNDDVQNIEKHFKQGSVSLFFQSNFFEHLITPNIRYCGGKYWDFWDHITPLTEKSLIEITETIGFKIAKCLPKFLPFTTKSRLPQNGWIVWLYLKLMPLSGWLFGEQSLILLSK